MTTQQIPNGAQNRKHDATIILLEEIIGDYAGDDDVLTIENELRKPEEAKPVKPPRAA